MSVNNITRRFQRIDSKVRFGEPPKPGRRGDRSNASAERGGYNSRGKFADFAIFPDNQFSGDFYIDEKGVRAAQQPPYQFNAVDTRSALKVDFWQTWPEPFDREMLRRRVRVMLFGEHAWISTAEDVVLHKLVWDRVSPSERQLADAAGIVAVQANALDKNYLRSWAQELNVTGKLERLLGREIKPKST
jgi:hypothetical protein